GPINFFNNAAQSTGASGDLNSAFGFSLGNIGGYAGTGSVDFGGSTVANFANVNRFLTSSGSSAGFQYGSYYTFDLGTIVAGTVITITHDDGAAFFQGASQIGNTVTGPTGQSTTTFTVGTTGNTILRYSRQNGTPSILVVDAVSPVPEPATWAMMMLGFGAMGAVIRRRKTTTSARIRFA
ncbi:MAG: PEP-CTERM sorting domain-containing protein, partial [Hyphomicrobiales bacterium]